MGWATVKTIAAHEWRQLWHGRLFLIAGVIVAAILCLLLGFGCRDFIEYRRAEYAASENQRRLWLERDVANAHAAAHAGITVFRPLPLLGVLDPGLHPYAGTSVFLEAHRRNDLAGSLAESLPDVLRMSLWNVSHVLQIVLPLLLVVLLAPAFAGERQDGTLRLLLSIGVSPRHLLIGKAIGMALPVMAVLMPLIFAAWCGIALISGLDAAMIAIPRLLIFVLSYLLYLAAFSILMFAISARSSSVKAAVASGLTMWIVLCFLVPRLANEVGAKLYPTAVAEEVAASIQSSQKAQEKSGWFDRRKQIEQALIQRYGVASAKDLPVNPMGKLLSEWEERTTSIQNAHYRQIYERQESQHRVLQLSGIFSPTPAIAAVSMALSGSDPQHLRHFSDFADEYRFRMAQMLNDESFHSALGKSRHQLAAEFHAHRREIYERLPPFRYESPSLEWSMKNVFLGWSALVLWTISAVVVAMIAIRHLNAF